MSPTSGSPREGRPRRAVPGAASGVGAILLFLVPVGAFVSIAPALGEERPGVATPVSIEAATPATGLDFAGTNAWVRFDGSSPLALPTFTIELWFRRDGPGVATTTGAGGLPDVVPMMARGSDESEKANQDINYLLGIRPSDGVLVADFEEGAGGASPSLNHPITGTTPVGTGVWHHAAATYDGTTWRLYLDGLLEAEQSVGQPAASASTVLFSLATASDSHKKPHGYFEGAMDEARVWSYARSEAEIQSTANGEIETAMPGLIGCWAMNDGSGNHVNGTAGTSITGSIQNSDYSWIAGAPFDLVFNRAPVVSAAPEPSDGQMSVHRPVLLEAFASDPDGDPLTITFHGRMIPPGASAPPFTLIGLPDTQYYVGRVNGGTPEMFDAQTAWIAQRRVPDNIVYVAHLGDCVENGDNGGDPVEWLAADAAMRTIEDPVATGLAEGVPYGVAVGNHDQSPLGSADGSTSLYNQYFGVGRFAGRSYYGGHYGSNNDNWYDFFSVGELEFIVISMEYDESPDPTVLDWADQLLDTHPDRRGIIVSHYICRTGNPGDFGPQGQAIYDALKGHQNLMLMLCGHVPGEGRRVDVYQGRDVPTLLADYQNRANGGDGWLRVMQFVPDEDLVHVRTYSPWRDEWEADADSSSQFTLGVRLTGAPPFAVLGTVTGVPSGGEAAVPWSDLAPDTTCQWYVTVDDGHGVVRGPTWTFRTAEGEPPVAHLNWPNGGEMLVPDVQALIAWDASDNVGVTSVDLFLSRSGPGGPFEEIATGLPNTGTYAWMTSGPATTDAYVEVVARDDAGNSGADLSDAAFTIAATTEVPVSGRVAGLVLGPVVPNPMTGTARMSFELPEEADARLEIFDIQGRRTAVLAEGVRPAGRHELVWDGRDGDRRAEPGLYFVRLVVADRVLSRRFVRIR